MTRFRTSFVALGLFGLVTALVAPVTIAGGGQVKLEGDLVQGGVVFGRVAQGADVTLDGRRLRTDPEGRFVFGFHRDAPAEAVLSVRLPGGTLEERRLAVESREYRIQRIDGLPQNMVTPPESVYERIKADAAKVRKARAVELERSDFAEGFIWPARGRISGVYGSQRILNGKPKQPHYGIDVAAPTGSPVWAPAGGVVTLAEDDLYYTGGTIILDHGHGLSSTFLHLETVTVKVGDELRQGDPLGTIGATGRATGPHLDWRMNWFEARVDPQLLVGPMPKDETN